LEDSQTSAPICIWLNPHDVTPPTITFLNSVLPSGYTVTPLNPPAQYPGDQGVLIQDPQDNGKIPPFRDLTFGITTDKSAICKWDLVRQNSYQNMTWTMMGGIENTEGLVGYNHTLSIPILVLNNASTQGGSIQKSGPSNLYIRCNSSNGFADVNAFDIQFVVDTTPPITPPQIEGTSILNGAPVAFGTTSTNVDVYLNEPESGCRWDYNNYAYSNMGYNMSCSNSPITQGLYAGYFDCTANLNGLKNGVANNFYFLCNDTYGNVDSQGYYPYTLMGTEPLVISSVSPTNGTLIQDSTDNVKVTLNVQTSGGQNQGQATCYYSSTGNGEDWTQFAGPASYQNSEDLYLPSGSYTYYIKCVDLAGNAAYSSAYFNVQTVTQPPGIISATHQSANLVIQTNVNSTCVYDIVDCTYPISGGTAMSTSDGITFSTPWVAGQTYYIKCEDSFSNQPAPNTCTIVLSPSEV
jgi:hypothetical protein